MKDSADNLEKWEIARNASIASDSFRRQEQRLRQQQQKALAALLKRIQRDRGVNCCVGHPCPAVRPPEA